MSDLPGPIDEAIVRDVMRSRLTRRGFLRAARRAGDRAGIVAALDVRGGSGSARVAHDPLAHIGFDTPFVAVTVRARVAGLDRSLEDAAKDLYATPPVAFARVTLPLIAPGIVAGFMLAFVLSLDDFVVTQFTSGQAVTFPLWVYGSSRIGIPPSVNVFGTLLFAGGVTIALVSAFARRRRRIA